MRARTALWASSISVSIEGCARQVTATRNTALDAAFIFGLSNDFREAQADLLEGVHQSPYAKGDEEVEHQTKNAKEEHEGDGTSV